MEMTYREPQTPLFPPSYVNLVNTKDHWKIGESEHNTDCDVTVGITNSYAPNFCINPPMFYASRQPNHQKFCRYCEETSEDNSAENKCYVPGCAGDVKCRDGLVSVFRKARKANNVF